MTKKEAFELLKHCKWDKNPSKINDRLTNAEVFCIVEGHLNALTDTQKLSPMVEKRIMQIYEAMK
jgi:hypothetical protein